ncbi:MAG: hypothetical protein WC703_10675 [Candidatus Neomarinimicrobiota bacterium]
MCIRLTGYHLYGSYFEDFQNRFLRAIESRTFEQRTYRYDAVCEIMQEAIPGIRRKSESLITLI